MMSAVIDWLAQYDKPINKRMIAPIQKPEKLPETIPDKIVREVTVDMTELIAEYFNKHSPIQPSTFANFQVIQSQTTLLTH